MLESTGSIESETSEDGTHMSLTDMAPDQVKTVFNVAPGRVYELGLVLRRREGMPGSDALSISDVGIVFRDEAGVTLDPELACEQPLLPNLDPAKVETLPFCTVNDEILAGAEALQLLVTPPDAVELQIEVDNDVDLLRCFLNPVNVLWSTREAERVRAEVRQLAEYRKNLLQRHFETTHSSSVVLEAIGTSAIEQINTLIARFKHAGSWNPVLNSISKTPDYNDFNVRMERLRHQAEALSRVGFIGSERGYERLYGLGDIFWLREEEYEDQLALLDLDLIIIETAPYNGAGDEDAEWHLAFSNLDGTLPDRGLALLEAAKARRIPVHLWVTTSPYSATLWGECARRVARIIAEGETEDWSFLGDKVRAVPAATEPAACSVATVTERNQNRMLLPMASDFFHIPNISNLVTSRLPYAPLLAEFRYRFKRPALDERLHGDYIQCVGEHRRAHQRSLLQAAGIVLILTESLRSDQEMAALAMDAITSGSIPVLYGSPRSDNAILHQLDRVFTSLELMELQALYRIHWLRERRWRGLMRYVMRHHTWKSKHRRALLRRDPFPRGFDQPMISAILVSKRPHLIKQCFKTFRKQSWKNKELVLILNMDKLPEDIPKLRKNEYVFNLPEAANIGECLNRGIAHSNGRYWAKMDDDDFYSSTYLEETVHYYRSAQTDLVGRQSAYFYFSGQKSTLYRPRVFDRCSMMRTTGHVSGATLSADKRFVEKGFSGKDRNSADSNWIGDLIVSGKRTYSADASSMIVFRDSDENQHTWKINPTQVGVTKFDVCTYGNIFNLLEKKL